MIVSLDGSKGFPAAVEVIFPKTRVQMCVVHKIRSSIRYVPDKDKKAAVGDLEPIYHASNKQQGYEKSLEFEHNGRKGICWLKSWLHNWVNFFALFKYDQAIRKIIYTSNPIKEVSRYTAGSRKSPRARAYHFPPVSWTNRIILNI